ncbi:hypothetical protein [Funiculus sociatus]|uniref:hypothetical protein n=1 Tax=Funiculus sociatus TaxID=450527 RepID=UPI0032973F76
MSRVFIQMDDIAIASRVGQYNSQEGASAIAAVMNSSDGSLKIPLSDNAGTNDQQINCSPQLFDKDEFQQQLTTLVCFWIGEEHLPRLKLGVTTVDGKT